MVKIIGKTASMLTKLHTKLPYGHITKIPSFFLNKISSYFLRYRNSKYRFFQWHQYFVSRYFQGCNQIEPNFETTTHGSKKRWSQAFFLLELSSRHMLGQTTNTQVSHDGTRSLPTTTSRSRIVSRGSLPLTSSIYLKIQGLTNQKYHGPPPNGEVPTHANQVNWSCPLVPSAWNNNSTTAWSNGGARFEGEGDAMRQKAIHCDWSALGWAGRPVSLSWNIIL